MKTAIDVSQYSKDIPVAKFQQAKAQGCSRVIVALNDLVLATSQIANAHAAGLEVQAYAYLYFNSSKTVSMQVQEDLAALRGTPVKHLWLDAEDTTKGVSAQKVVSGLTIARDLVRGAHLTTGIYTARWYWEQFVGNSTVLASLPLWDAFWDKDKDIDTPTYGGWTTAAMSQHTPDTYFAGIWCDINSYEDPNSPPMTEADGVAVYKAVLGLNVPGATVEPLPIEGNRRVYKVKLPL